MKFLTRLLLFSVVLYGVTLLVQGQLPGRFRFDAVPQLLLFFTLLLVFFNWWISRPLRSERGIVNRYLGATTGKLLLCLAVMAVYIFTHREATVPFAVHFLVFYLLYTVFEVAMLYGKFSGTSRA